ncbi:Calpain-9-like [Oopsacas minuta]|uniref:Calpain-9-like n=1 Tax=Oopsacas minuta TaxID=111878 RepID=A0AAV7KA85_9METZ|nr:Calpain-9-like [Oopsacas minuta]
MLGAKLSSQDFISLRRQLNSENKLFTDPYFPPEAQSVFYSQKSPVKFVWCRPPDFAPDPKLMVDGASRFDVTQGMLGDCWLLSAMASLAQNQSLLRVVVPNDQSFEKQYAGIFHFRLWHFGEWIDVVIDDYLPTYKGKLVFAHSPEKNELWPALLEKAYAKLHGSYEALKGGRTSEAMEDFTGGIKEIVDMTIRSKDLFSLLYKSVLRSDLISCSIIPQDKSSGEVKLDNGLIAGHAYTVTDARSVHIPKQGMLEMVRVRNPWGNEREWKGDWSDNSPQWRCISDEERNELELVFADDGEFWMSFEDFRDQFTEMEICHSSIDDLDENESIESWNLATFSGSWSKQKGTAGGCLNFPTFCNNPQISIELREDANADGKCSVIIALMQKDCRAQKCLGFQSNSIGFSIYKQPDTPLTKKFTDYNRSVGNSGSFTNLREVSGRFDLPAGKYVVIPCIFKPGSEGTFLLRIFTEKSIIYPNRDVISEVVDTSINAVEDLNLNSTRQSVSSKRLKRGEQMFLSIAGSDGRVDADELLDVIIASLSRNLEKNVLERETCRALIQLVDKDRAGSLNYEQCTMLIEYICKWKRVFTSVVENRSDTISRHQLSLALQELGYDLSTECLEVVINRFSSQEKISIQDFIAIVCRVKMLTDIFKVKHDPKKKTLTFSLETLLLNALKL